VTDKRRRRLHDANASPLGLDVAEVVGRIRAGKRVRRSLRPWGRLHIDRALPFLCVYRRPEGVSAPQTEALVTTQACYLLAPGEPSAARGLAALVRGLVGALLEDFGACLLMEIYEAKPEETQGSKGRPPLFRIVTPDGEPRRTVGELENCLSRFVETGAEEMSSVEVGSRLVPSPNGMPLLVSPRDGFSNCFVVGLEVRPVYADARGDREFPLVHRRLRRELSIAMKRTAFEFTTRRTTHRPEHYHALGREKFVKAVWEVDRKLADVSNRFDFLLLSTPRNSDAAWAAFRRSRFGKAPVFSYPPLPFDPALAKRRLYEIPVERIEDPTLEDLFSEQQDELDRKITMLADRDTPRFRYGSLQLYGAVDDELFGQAKALLDRIPSRSRESSKGITLDARTFATRAEEELKYLRREANGLNAKVLIRKDLSGLMVSRGNLLVPAGVAIPAARVDALVQHEIGTHIVTYYNGDAQPFRQLRNGLPGYDELQEGMAVLAEYLVGGLSRSRLRTLAARVLAVRRMTTGASFVEVFRELDRDYDFAQRTAYLITMRVFRGGGQAKDAVYLRGLSALLDYLGTGGDLDALLVGKIGLQHLDVIHELQVRGVLVPPPYRPRYMDLPAATARLEKLRAGARVIDLANPEKRRTL